MSQVVQANRHGVNSSVCSCIEGNWAFQQEQSKDLEQLLHNSKVVYTDLPSGKGNSGPRQGWTHTISMDLPVFPQLRAPRSLT